MYEEEGDANKESGFRISGTRSGVLQRGSGTLGAHAT
jgi:hypothetical protein